jgi:hypothetical protein
MSVQISVTILKTYLNKQLKTVHLFICSRGNISRTAERIFMKSDTTEKLNSLAFSPQANYTDRARVGEVSANFCE